MSSEYEPAEELLLAAKKEASRTLKNAEKEAEKIRLENSKIVERHVKELEATLGADVEREYAAKYSQLKIDYDKKIQDLLFNKVLQLKVAIVTKIAANPEYADFLNSFLSSNIASRSDARIYAGPDMRLLSMKGILTDEKMGHGVRVELPEKVLIFSLEDFVEKYVHKNPLVAA